jgi:hypothetical protein
MRSDLYRNTRKQSKAGGTSTSGDHTELGIICVLTKLRWKDLKRTCGIEWRFHCLRSGAKLALNKVKARLGRLNCYSETNWTIYKGIQHNLSSEVIKFILFSVQLKITKITKRQEI